MNLVVALYAESEGVTEYRFLPSIIRRTSEDILLERSIKTVDVEDAFILKLDSKPPTQRERIVQAARQAIGYHILIIHIDADGPNAERAFNDRYLPGSNDVADLQPPLSTTLVPIIPVRMTEARMIADPDAFIEVVGANADAKDLGLPSRPQMVEAEAKPKHILQQAIQKATYINARRRRKIDFESIHGPLSNSINLELLKLVPSYRKFVEDFSLALANLGFIR